MSFASRLTIAIATLGIALPGQLVNQVNTLEGQQVRVNLNSEEQLIGRLVSAERGALVIETMTGQMEIDLETVTSLERYRGTRRHVWAGVGIGALVGGISLAAVASSGEPCTGFCVIDDDEALLLGAVAGLLGGGLVGAVIGALIKTESWEPMVIPASFTTSGTVAIGLRWSPSWLGGAR